MIVLQDVGEGCAYLFIENLNEEGKKKKKNKQTNKRAHRDLYNLYPVPSDAKERHYFLRRESVINLIKEKEKKKSLDFKERRNGKGRKEGREGRRVADGTRET